MIHRRALLLFVPWLAAACDAGGGGAWTPCHDPLVTADADVSADGGAGRTCRRSEPVFVCDVPNARDLVGTPVASGQTVACGAIYRGAPLAALSVQGCQAFTALGIKTVVDLRTPGEVASRPSSPCVTAAARVVAAPMPVPYDVSPTDYLADLNTSSSVTAAFAALGDPAAYPVYVHCTYGRDRTGVLAALILSALGATRQEILQEYLLSAARVGAFPASLSAVLDDIDRRGGIDAVLGAAGVTSEQLATLRARALVP
jgi:protein tyrosine phosphatase (PTP) superfamily phosphohydrolase (DUF442 family)